MNGGSGPSDRQAARAGRPARARCPVTSTAPTWRRNPKRLLPEYSDEFDGAALGGAWAWQRDDIAPTATVADGVLSIPVQAADLYVESTTPPSCCATRRAATT